MKQILFLLGHLCNRRQQDAEHWVLEAAYHGVMIGDWLHFGLDLFFFRIVLCIYFCGLSFFYHQ
jgi:hypothetical protein